MQMKKIILKCVITDENGEQIVADKHEVDHSLVNKSRYLSEAINTMNQSADLVEIEISNVKPNILKKLLQFWTHHKDNEVIKIDKPMIKPFNEQLDDWSKE